MKTNDIKLMKCLCGGKAKVFSYSLGPEGIGKTGVKCRSCGKEVETETYLSKFNKKCSEFKEIRKRARIRWNDNLIFPENIPPLFLPSPEFSNFSGTLVDGKIVELPGSRVEVWRLKDSGGRGIRFYKKHPDGKISEHLFAISEEMALAFARALFRSIYYPKGIEVMRPELTQVPVS